MLRRQESGKLTFKGLGAAPPQMTSTVLWTLRRNLWASLNKSRGFYLFAIGKSSINQNKDVGSKLSSSLSNDNGNPNSEYVDQVKKKRFTDIEASIRNSRRVKNTRKAIQKVSSDSFNSSYYRNNNLV